MHRYEELHACKAVPGRPPLGRLFLLEILESEILYAKDKRS